jgi:hypothetical protein
MYLPVIITPDLGIWKDALHKYFLLNTLYNKEENIFDKYFEKQRIEGSSAIRSAMHKINTICVYV